MTYCPPPSTSEKRGYPDGISAKVLGRLTEVGLVDDAAFAEQWVQSRRANAGKGKRALAAELRTKGLDEDVIAVALDGLGTSVEHDRAVKLVQTRLRRENLDGDEAKVARRLAGMLARRGYSETLCFEVVKTEMALELERRRT
jgi:regulatory protein